MEEKKYSLKGDEKLCKPHTENWGGGEIGKKESELGGGVVVPTPNLQRGKKHFIRAQKGEHIKRHPRGRALKTGKPVSRSDSASSGGEGKFLTLLRVWIKTMGRLRIGWKREGSRRKEGGGGFYNLAEKAKENR